MPEENTTIKDQLLLGRVYQFQVGNRYMMGRLKFSGDGFFIVERAQTKVTDCQRINRWHQASKYKIKLEWEFNIEYLLTIAPGMSVRSCILKNDTIIRSSPMTPEYREFHDNWEIGL